MSRNFRRRFRLKSQVMAVKFGIGLCNMDHAGTRRDLKKAQEYVGVQYERAVAWPRVNVIGRMGDNDKALLLMLGEKPTDDAMRAIQDTLNGRTPTPTVGAQPASHGYVKVQDFIEQEDEYVSMLNDLFALLQEVKAERDAATGAQVRPVMEATEEMTDSVRYLFIGMEQPGQTFGGIRKHCEWAGMNTSHWPAWTKDRDAEHFNKSARAALVWHCMQRAQENSNDPR